MTGYVVTFELIFDKGKGPNRTTEKKIREAFEKVSDTAGLAERPPATQALLRKRAEGDLPKLEDVLKALSYFLPEIELLIDSEASPVKVIYRIRPGRSYRIDSAIVQDKKGTDIWPVDAAEIGLAEGNSASADVIKDSKNKLLRWFRHRGFAFPVIADPKAIVDHKDGTVDIVYVVDPGPMAYFGPVKLEGLTTVDESLVLKKIPWKTGDRFDIELLEKARSDLTSSMLFSLVRLTTADEIDENNLLPVSVTVEERGHRTIGVGAGYRTDEGFGAKLLWEHRNLFGGGE